MKSSCAERIKLALSLKDLTQSDLCRMTEISKSTMSQYLSGKYEPSQLKTEIIARALNVSEAWLMGYDVPMERSSSQPPKQGIKIPVLGDVAAGVPIAAIEDVLDYEEIDADMASRGEYFGLRIKGASMEPRMTTGDVVIVRCQPTVDSGDTAVVLVNGDSATVKKVKITKDGILLIPTNPAFEPMFYTRQEIQDLPVVILGKVVELRAKF